MAERAFSVLAFLCLSSLACASAGPTYNASFAPWTVMGPVNTKASGYAVMTYMEEGYDYEIYLYNVVGLHSIELHLAAPGTHGDVAAVFYAAGIANASLVQNGLIAKGTLEGHDFLGPLLLPLAQHLPASVLQDSYMETGNAIVVVHTLANRGGELGAQIVPSGAPSPSSGAGMTMSHGAMHGMAAPAPMDMSGMAGMASMPDMAGMPGMPGMNDHAGHSGAGR